MHTITLPRTAKNNAISSIIPLLNEADLADTILLDFRQVEFYYPAAIVALLARCRHWLKLGKTIRACNFNACPASNYLKRIDFFDQLGLQLNEEFQRHAPNGRFVAVKRVNWGDSSYSSIVDEVASCMARANGELRACLNFSIGEIITNVAQHSQGEGFLCAQRYPKSGIVHFAVADTGIGLRNSFTGTTLESSLDTDLKALEKSMEPEVSSALLRPLHGPYQEYVNRGIGLSMVNEITRQTYGEMHVITGNAHFQRIGDTSVRFCENDRITNQGVLVSLQLNTDEIDNFQEIITRVREVVIPLKLDNWDEMFE